MSNSNEIRFVRNGKEVVFNEKGKMKGNGKKELKALEPIFDAIAKLEGKSNRIDSDKERELLRKLQDIVAADGLATVSNDELKLGDEFTNSGKDIAEFINSKHNEISKPSAPAQPAQVQTVENNNAQGTQTEGKKQTTEAPAPAQSAAPEQSETKSKTQAKRQQQSGAYNQTIQNLGQKYDKEALKEQLTQAITIKKGDTLYDIAKEALKAEGVENPTGKQINERIAQIAKLNNINNVNKIIVGKNIYVSAQAISSRPAAANTPAGTTAATQETAQAQGAESAQETTSANKATKQSNLVKQGPITVSKAPDLSGYSSETKTLDATNDSQGFEYKVHTKQEGEGENQTTSTVYSCEIDTITLYADNLEDLKKQYAAITAGIKAPEPNGTDYSKAEGYTKGSFSEEENRKIPDVYKNKVEVYTKGSGEQVEKEYQITSGNVVFSGTDLDTVITNYTNNYVADLRAQIEATNGNLSVITPCIQDLRDNVDLNNPNAKALVQDLIKTKDGDVITNIVSHVDFFSNDETSVDLVGSLLQEIVAKENSGEKLTNEEVALKDMLTDNTNKCWTDNDEEDTFKQHDHITGEILSGLDLGDGKFIYSKDRQLLLDFKADKAALESVPESEKSAKAQEIYKKYIEKAKNSADEEFLSSLYANAEPAFDTETTIELIKVAGARTLASMEYESFADFDEETNSAYLERVKELYLSDNSKGDLKNVRFLSDIFNNINNMKKVPDYDEDGNIKTDSDGKPVYIANTNDYRKSLGDKVCETYFTKSEDGSVTFNPPRRLTYEEMDSLARTIRWHCSDSTKASMQTALINTIKVEDMGAGQYTAALEAQFDTTDVYAELTKDMSADEIVDFIKNKMVNDKGGNIPYDSILARFDVTAENKELYTELIKNIDSSSSNENPSFANREKLISGFMNGDKLEIPDGVTVNNIANAFPQENGNIKFNKVTKKAFKEATLSKITADNVTKGVLDTLYNRTAQMDLKTLADDKFVEIIKACTDGEILFEMVNHYHDGIYFALQNVNVDNIKTHTGDLKSIIDDIPKLNPNIAILNKAVENKWITKQDFTSAEGNKTTKDIYKIGDKFYRATIKDKLVTFKEINETGVQAGLDIYGYVEGANWGHDDNLYKTINSLDSNTVVDAIKEFNRQSKSDHIMTWLANEWGPSKDDVNNIPTKLLEWAKANGLEKDDDYKALAAKIKEDGYWDYSESVAKEMDNLMEALIAKVENHLKIDVPDGTANQEAVQKVMDQGSKCLADALNGGIKGDITSQNWTDKNNKVIGTKRFAELSDGRWFLGYYDSNGNLTRILISIGYNGKSESNFGEIGIDSSEYYYNLALDKEEWDGTINDQGMAFNQLKDKIIEILGKPEQKK